MGPRTRYAQTSDGIHIAFQLVGEGERDMVLVPGLMSHVELIWEEPETADFYQRLAKLGRLILFDKRDTGLSDRAPGDMSLEERMEDVRALILASASARWFPAPGYPCGQGTQEMYDALRDIAAHRWGQGATIDWYLPSQAHSARARQLLGRFERMAVNPSAFLRLTQMIHDIDVRALLPAIRVPTLVIQRLGDRITPPCHGRYLASHITGARYFEQEGDHSLRFAASGDNDALYAEIADFLASTTYRADPDRVLATSLHATMVTGRAGPETGNVVRGYRGRLIGTTADGILATFDAPGQAIRCAAAVRERAAAAGTRFRAGIHTW